ncbi:BIG/ATPase V1 complex, subunit S1 [Truncatella angustata]|uniref:Protein BIG1 n=1 Tax=Truncatella angustata TaxID=152316 RepID=A0A9P8UF91_9PEZI|nr:BIG/ATPase V1 complex, subunit S1 [Truncatella angustata]KAH6648886.1 BIG/ATPase V1 complex, subunit S1 [Truncatella angustata]KAH8198855.1 hypothetical protein TruAng_006963 [Truncatella angustata]
MRLSTAATVAACCATAHAFTNTSPFVLFSTERLDSPLSDELHANSSVLKAAGDFLSSCPTQRYLLVSQPNLNIQHLGSSSAAPKLQAALSSRKVQGRMTISEMSGVADIQKLESAIRESCQAAGKTPSVDTLNLEPIPAGGRFQDIVESLRESDEDLGLVLQQYDAAGDFTVIYTAGAHTEKAHEEYEAEFKDTTHQELKRRNGNVQRQKQERDTRPLFEKYQFFTPGIFMVLVALLLLFSILGVGIAALGSLQVPYGAFDKEMGPAAQKKQQ